MPLFSDATNLIKSMKLLLILSLAFITHTFAQNSVYQPNPIQSLTPKQRATLAIQGQAFRNAAQPAVKEAAKSTVIISFRGYRLSFGTVVTSPLTSRPIILSKWSEIARFRNHLVVSTPQGKYARARVVGVYPTYDLAVLTTDLKLTPINLLHSSSPQLGDFIALANPDGTVHSLGVVSVKSRSLRDSDKAFLGVLMDFENPNQHGIPLSEVVPNSPADHAGLQPGDIVISINNRKIKSSAELKNALVRLVPGSDALLKFRRGKDQFTTSVHLASRPKELDPRRVPPARLRQMQRMGTIPNQVKQDFPNVIQSDMKIQVDETPNDPRDDASNDCGGPVVDLDGKLVGLAIARGSRIKTFIIPTNVIRYLITKPATALPDEELYYGQNRQLPPPRAIQIDW